ncbi:MAG: hypothetical protein M3299_10650 [Thermoproteota archaeon]|nr:hypothetical protein [Thermoproteota archaeon]
MSINNSNNKEQRKPFLALIGDDNTTASILGLMLLAAASFALISSITPMTAAIAQELANNNTTRQAGGAGVQSSACTPTQTGGTFDDGVSVGGTSAFDDYDADMEGDDSSATASTTNSTNSITAGESSRNQSMSEAGQHIEEACLMLHSGDTQGALMQLNLALNGLGDGTQE